MSDCWINREKDHIAKMMQKDYISELTRRYQSALDNIKREIDAFYSTYADKENISIAEAKKRAAKHDVQAFARKAKKYVEEKNFSKKANEELRLYNLTMKVNRLELLKSNIGLELIALGDDLEKYTNVVLTDEALEEARRQAGILGQITKFDEKAVKDIVDASFHNATFSELIWSYQDILKSTLDKQLTQGILQGISPLVMARKIQDIFKSSRYEAERLFVTESARIQTEIQRDSYNRYGYEQYVLIIEPGACKKCRTAEESNPIFVRDMTIGVNAPPLHPNCRCSTSAYFDDKEWKKDLENRLEKQEKRLEKAYNKNKQDTLFGEPKDWNLTREEAAKRLKKEFGMKLSETSRTKLTKVALNQVYGVLKQFEGLYNKLPQKIPQVRALPKSKAKNAIARYSYYSETKTPAEFGINVEYFKNEELLSNIVKSSVKEGWFSKNSNSNHIMIHEFGHHIDYQLSKLNGSSFSDAVFSKFVDKYNSKYNLDTIGKEISNYANFYYRECGKHTESFAEIFAEAYGDTPREIAADFKKEFEKMVREVLENADKAKGI